ncbi:MAG: clostripain-related cysteine peptidase [Terracidiphilus sp.]|jgi:hypothetical protein
MPGRKWGIYVYYAADVESRQMQQAAWQSLQSLASAGSTNDIGITAMIDLPVRDTAYYVMPPQPAGRIKQPVYPDRFLPNVNSASIETLADFLQWSTVNCPAENVALVFWGHGYAIDDFDPTLQPGSPTGVSGKGREGQRAIPGISGARGHELSLLFDSTHDAVLNNRDFGNLLRTFNAGLRPQLRIQVLGLDCCNMAMAEVLSELQDYAQCVVAAESLLPFRSWLSEDALTEFLERGSTLAPEQFSVGAVDMFIDSYDPETDPYIELSAFELSQFPALEQAMKGLTEVLIEAIDTPENRDAIDRAYLSDVSFLVDGFIDLGTFCSFLAEMIDEEGIRNAVNAVLEALNNVVMRCRFAPNDPRMKIALATGMSIWFPPWIRFPGVRYPQIDRSRAYLFNGYPQTRFAQVTNWDRFLLKLYSVTQLQ